jgi:Na+/pantothenate symporter
MSFDVDLNIVIDRNGKLTLITWQARRYDVFLERMCSIKVFAVLSSFVVSQILRPAANLGTAVDVDNDTALVIPYVVSACDTCDRVARRTTIS